MDLEVIGNVVSQIGFPIAVCFVCFYYIWKMEQRHKDEMDKMAEAINNNTKIMQKIYDKLGLED